MPTLDYGTQLQGFRSVSSGGRANTSRFMTVRGVEDGSFGFAFNTPRAQPHSLLLIGTRGVPPVAAFAFALTPAQVLVVFSMRMLHNINLTFVPNYVITPAVGSTARAITAVTSPHLSGVYSLLDLDGSLTPGTSNYTVTIANVQSLNGIFIDPNEDTLSFSGPTGELTIVDAEALADGHTVRLSFSDPVRDNPALRCVDSYEIRRNDDNEPLVVHSIVPEAITNPTYVDLTTDEMQEALDHYNFTIHRIERA